MANIKSSKKRIRITEAKTLRNKMVKSSLKTTIKKFEAAVTAQNVEEAKVALKDAVKALDMAVSKGVIHKNMASRKKSRLAAKLNALSA
ncbi:30S ribosomal protein S20 [Clostridium sp. MSJ-4]|uniref:Small ribosomal subunit protein bS20 n=1 Tax=Clostridium simiarum TaxID=2841506 RepID=A0ABS6EY82_9CLOT|nr:MULTISPECIES: 30S ribosomal protein S20 [Clostridium]MBU5591041.1 30S ribosomal protein S20 [Clostridium simiarum]